MNVGEKNQKKSQRSVGMWTVLLVVLLMLIVGIIVFSYENSNLKQEKEYYKEQMLDFCGIAKTQNDLLSEIFNETPILEEDCDYWILSWDN